MLKCPVKKVIEVDNGEVRLYDFACVARQNPSLSNVVRVGIGGEIIWYAELPSENNLYIGMGREAEGIWCGTIDSIVCTIDLATGKIIKKQQIE